MLRVNFCERAAEDKKVVEIKEIAQLTVCFG